MSSHILNSIVEANSTKTSIDVPLRKIKFTKTLILACIATTFGTSIPVGYNLAVVNAPAEHIRSWCNETILQRYNVLLSIGELEMLWAIVVSIFLIGGTLGSLCGSWISDKYGRKMAFLVSGILYLCGVLFFMQCRTFNSVEFLLIGRILVGIASGLSTSTAPMYLAEISPPSFRGSFGTFFSVGLTTGIVIGQVFSLEEFLGNENNWQYAFSAFGLFNLVPLILYHCTPESPKYLYVIAGREMDARYELKRLRGNNYQLDDEISNMVNESNNATANRSILSILSDPILLLPIVLVVTIQAGHQFSGINAIFYYSVSMFESAKINPTTAKWINFGGGVTNLLSVFLSTMVVAHIKRRSTILMSSLLSGIFLLILLAAITVSDYSTWATFIIVCSFYGYVFVFAFGLGPMAHFIASELFESSTRSAAMSIGSLVAWFCNFLIGITFPMMQLAFGELALLPFAVSCFTLYCFLKYYLPETRGREPCELTPLISNGFKSRPLLL